MFTKHLCQIYTLCFKLVLFVCMYDFLSSSLKEIKTLSVYQHQFVTSNSSDLKTIHKAGF